MESGYFITSELEAGKAAELEELFFFNPNQWRIRKSVEAVIQEYGTPQITVFHGRVQMVLENTEGYQTLYLRHRVAEDRLVGTIVYVREQEALRVLFFALQPEHTMEALGGVNPLVMMFEALKEIGRRIVGVKSILYTSDRKELRLSVRNAP